MQAKEQHKVACKARNRYVTERIGNMADVESLKSAAFRAMLELKRIHRTYAG